MVALQPQTHIEKTHHLRFYTDHRKNSNWLSHVPSVYNVFSVFSLDSRIIKYVSAPGNPGLVTVSLFCTNKPFQNTDH